MIYTLYLRVSVGISVLLIGHRKEEEKWVRCDAKIVVQQEVHHQTLNSRQFGRCSRW